MNQSELKNLIREVIQEIDQEIKPLSGKQWKVDVPGIKIFFDITPFSGKALLGMKNDNNQTRFGSFLQIVNGLVHRDFNGVNHVGFILSDGRMLDATNSYGITIRNGDEIKEHPENYVVMNVGGNEDDLLKRYKVVQSYMTQGQKGYDWKGIARKFPLLGKLLNRIGMAKETGNDKFYCSELVSNLLIQVGILKLNDLVSLSENISDLDTHDEIDPQTLYKLIKTKAKLVPIV